jgi:site-specific DNA-methyltransferase (adenine-specific)
MEETIGGIEHVDHILTDPPYLYIKTHDFDRPWDERLFFENAKRMLPDDGFIALFGRGTSFYRWNTILANLGFKFKEEIVWNKMTISSPSNNIMRTHETVSIHSKKNGVIKKVRCSYIEQKHFNIESLINDIKRITSALGNERHLSEIKEFIETGKLKYIKSKSIHNITRAREFLTNDDRAVYTFSQISNGLIEKSIISIYPDHFGSEHPTQKPVRLAERLLALISNTGSTIYDPFMGSGSFGVACLNTGRKYIGSEMKEEYFEIACKRIKEAAAQGRLDLENNLIDGKKAK